jgi:CheY-like chemotaxis protein
MFGAMTQPMALIWFGKLLLGSRLTHKLEELGYRVQSLTALESLAEEAERDKPLVVLMGMDSQPERVADAISSLKNKPVTSHLPVIAIVSAHSNASQQTALAAGAKLAVPDTVVLDYLDQFLQQALDMN